ncbi:MAG TPA: cbb3-type cytochrome c oxidase subunit I, partial [Woeseiaceae bacterium]|nr:cbb3-type cytochrome c oxidase subunit I [Woeseiaceae bacterium]
MTDSNPSVSYSLRIGGQANRQTIIAWLLLGLVSLVAAGVFSILLVLARTPVIQGLIPLLDFFRIALVVHVTLSVLVWLLAMSALNWSLITTRDNVVWDRLSFLLAAFGTAIIIVCPFLGAGDPLMNNYVPVLRHPLFYVGLGLFTAGIFSHLLRAASCWPGFSPSLSGTDALHVGIALSTGLTGLALLAVLASWLSLPDAMDGQVYFEFLFWGGGHIVQFSYTLLMMIAWVVLAVASGCRFELTPRLTLVFLVFLVLPVITVPFLYLAHDVTTAGHRLAFT